MGKPANKDEFRNEIATMFINALEEKGLQWKCGWTRLRPYNGITKRAYKGVNQFYLMLVAMRMGSQDPRWFTMTQITDRSGTYHKGQSWHLNKGTKAVYVEYWYYYDLAEKKSLTWSEYSEQLASGRSDSEFRLSTRYTPVFNGKDIEGLPELPTVTSDITQDDNVISLISTGMNVELLYDGGDRAYYVPSADKIHLPKPELFSSKYELNATIAHELAHATGHISRLHRDQKGIFGSEDYAKEELVAEIASSFMSIHFSPEIVQANLNNHKAYVQNWISIIRDKTAVLMKAIKDAQAAADYMEAYI